MTSYAANDGQRNLFGLFRGKFKDFCVYVLFSGYDYYL